MKMSNSTVYGRVFFFVFLKKKTFQKNVNKYYVSAEPTIFGSAEVITAWIQKWLFFFIAVGSVSIYGVSQFETMHKIMNRHHAHVKRSTWSMDWKRIMHVTGQRHERNVFNDLYNSDCLHIVSLIIKSHCNSIWAIMSIKLNGIGQPKSVIIYSHILLFQTAEPRTKIYIYRG